MAYVRAIAAQVGANPAVMDVDDDSVDITFMGRGYSGLVRNPQVQIQLKCTSQDLISGGVIKFQLPIKNYNDLRGDDLVCPRYLAVLLVPEDLSKWVDHLMDGMLLRNCCYWISIRDYPAVTNSTKVTVDIPLSQRLTSSVLHTMLTQASNRLSI